MSTVLVIDDSLANAQLTKVALETRGYDVLCAHDGDEGMQLAQDIQPALIVLDLRLPKRGLDGWEIIEIVRADTDLSGVPIIVTSVESQPDDRQRALQAGCNVYLPKPFDINELRNLVIEYIGA